MVARALPWLIAATAFVVFSLISVRQWAAYEFPSWDLGIFSSAAQGYSRGGPPIVSIKGDNYNLLGDHFHPILALTGPLWALWPSPLMLLVLQAVLFAISAVPLTRLAIDRLGAGLGAVVGCGYVFSWGIQAAHVVQFHEIAFAGPMLALSLTALVRERYGAAAIWASLLVTVKEDLGLTVIMVGAVIAWRGWRGWRGNSTGAEGRVGSTGAAERAGSSGTAERGWRGWRGWRGGRNSTAGRAGSTSTAGRSQPFMHRSIADARTIIIGVALATWGAVWAVLSMFVILPALSSEGQFEYTDNVGSLLDAFVPGTKWITVVLLILTMGVVGLRSPIWLIMLPTLAWRFTGTVEFYWGWTWHYSAVLMPIAVAALLDALGPTHSRSPEPQHTGASNPAPQYSGASSTTPQHSGASNPAPQHAGARAAARRIIAPVAVLSLLISSLAAHLLGPPLPVTDLASPITAQQREHRASADAVLAQLPDGDPLIAADISVMAPAVPHADVQWTHGPNLLTPSCAILDLDAFSWGGEPPADRAAWLLERYQARFELVMRSGAVELWCLEHQPTQTDQH